MSNSEVDRLLAILPPDLQKQLTENYDTDKLLEIILDFDRVPEARFVDNTTDLQYHPLELFDLDQVASKFIFASNNRAGIEGTLHRVSCIRNRNHTIVGLTLRVGKPVLGCAELIRDLLATGKSILVLGPPGAGKTTILRDAARILSSEMHKRVIIVDSSSEIGGDSDAPHYAVGKSRRMQVENPAMQAPVLLEACGNHFPQSIIIDEIATSADVQAARTIAERGVQLIATAHGKTIQNIIDNPMLSSLVGGVQTITISDDEARRQDCRKSKLDRKHAPTFDIIVEIVSFNNVKVHMDTAAAVDLILSGGTAIPISKSLENQKIVEITPPEPEEIKENTIPCWFQDISPGRAEAAIIELGLPLSVVTTKDQADYAFVLNKEGKKPRLNIPAYVVTANTRKALDQTLRKFMVDCLE